MEGLELKSEADKKLEAEENNKNRLQDTLSALSEAQRIVNEQEEEEARQKKIDEDPLAGPVDVDGHVESHAITNAADHGTDLDSDPKVPKDPVDEDDVEPDDNDKQAFIDALSTGSRYERSFSIFGGRIKGVFRARTIGESEAISAYGRRMALLHLDLGQDGYGDLMKLCLLTASVKVLGDVEYPEMASFGSLRYTEDENGQRDPGWVKQLDVWRSKPEAIMLAIMPEYFKFEAKYYAMTKRAADKNFWNSGPSTEK